MSESLYHHHDDTIRSDQGDGQSFQSIAEARYSRRSVLKSTLAAALFASAPVMSRAAQSVFNSGVGASTLTFDPIEAGRIDAIRIAPGYRSEVLIAWGDPMFSGAPEFDPNAQTAESAEQQFGYNNDYVGYLPYPYGSGNSNHGLLVVNFEYTEPDRMVANYPVDDPTAAHVEWEKAGHGMGVIEIAQNDQGEWGVVLDSPRNRRFTGETPFEVTGPAAAHPLMRTEEDPEGLTVRGTLGNCSGGNTPWGTVLSAEENFQSYFANLDSLADSDPRKAQLARYGVFRGEAFRRWENHDPRFDVAQVPNEAFRFGWVVEVDPYDPEGVPKKRTALGRFVHEAATTYVSKQDRVVLYSGDDARFEYVYKFVCRDAYNRDNRAANRDILDHGTLYVARFDEDGTGEWLPLVYGQGPLTPGNGFENQGDVVIHARLAADLLGATKMDRPEDIEVNPVNEKVYIVCTNNTRRGTDGQPSSDAANPRDTNRFGHIIELHEAGDDHAATRFEWEIFMLCGDPTDESTFFAGFPRERVSPIANPDNINFDTDGNLWIATDGANNTLGINDGYYAVPTEGPERGFVRLFMSGVEGSEICGPEFTPDNRTLFLAIQHPAEGSTFDEPSTRWPAGPDSNLPPRPAIIVIQAEDGGKIGREAANPIMSWLNR